MCVVVRAADGGCDDGGRIAQETLRKWDGRAKCDLALQNCNREQKPEEGRPGSDIQEERIRKK